MTNVLRHAHASSLCITFSADQVSVDDDGDGLGASTAGHGILGMQERARQIGAATRIGASSLGGTRVQLVFGAGIKEAQ